MRIMVIIYNYGSKECKICQKEYIPTGGSQKCCSKKCSKLHEKNYNKEYARSYRKTEKAKLYYKKNKGKYYLKNKEDIIRKSKVHYLKNREELLRKRKEYRENNPDKVKESKRESWQKHKVQNTIKANIYNQNPERKRRNSIRGLTRHFNSDKKEKCEICGSEENLEFHHPDYDKPKEFRVLCREHHTKEHRNLKKLKMETIFN